MSEPNDNIRIGKKSALVPSRSHTYANNTPFYAAVPHPFQQYYMRHVRNWFQWYDGYVDWFHGHQSGVFSTKLAQTLLHKIANQVVGKRILFDDEDTSDVTTKAVDGDELNSLRFTEKWARDNNLTQKIKRGMEYAFAGGDSLIKVDSHKKELSVSTVRKDNYFGEWSDKGDPISVQMLVYTYTNMVKDKNTQYADLFYIFEERKYDEQRKPVWRLSVKRGTGHMVTTKNVDFSSVDYNDGDVEFRDLPRNVREKLVQEFPNIEIGKWESLPYKDLGVYMIKATEGVSFMPSLPFGESLLNGIIHILMSYDFYYSAFNTDMYMARGRVLIPKHMENPHENSGDYEHYTGLDSFYYERIPYVEIEDQKPVPIQFDLRAEDWKTVRNNLLQMVAMQIGISERDVATFIVPASEKPSAKEISADENATARFMEDKREMLQGTLDKLIDCVLDYYDFGNEKVYVKFSKVGLTNINDVINQVAIMKQNNLVDLKTSLEMIFFDKSQKQIDNMYNKIKEEMKEKQEQTNERKMTTDPLHETEEGFKRESTIRQTKKETE